MATAQEQLWDAETPGAALGPPVGASCHGAQMRSTGITCRRSSWV